MMARKKTAAKAAHTSMRLHDAVKAILIGHAKQSGWSEAKVANLLIELGDYALRGEYAPVKAGAALLDAAGNTHRLRTKSDAAIREAAAEERKAAGKLRGTPPAQVTPEQLKGGA